MNSFIKKNWQNISILYLLAGSLVYWVVGIYLIRYLGRGGDGFIRWQESRYVLRHLNPLQVANGNIPPTEDVGIILFIAGSFPWIYILNDFLLPGFLGWNEAEVVALFLILILMAILVRTIYIRFQPEIGTKNAIICVLLATTSYAWLSGVRQFQHGVFVGIFLLLFNVIDHKKHPYLIGIIITFAMIKPQSAALFYLILLLKKEYRSIVTSFIMGVSATILAGVFVHENPISLTIEYLTNTAPIDLVIPCNYYGIFDFLKFYGVSHQTMMLSCIITSMVILAGMLWRFRKVLQELPVYVLCVIPAAISPLWTYNHAFDLQYFAIISIAGFITILENKQKKWAKFVIAAAIITATLPIPNSIYDRFWIIPLLQRLIQLVSAYIILLGAQKE